MGIPVLSWEIFFALQRRRWNNVMGWKLEEGGWKFYKPSYLKSHVKIA
ncbi:hypothetical protein J2Y40_004787 [Chryseobacterium sp. 2987]|nr:hypothetical protein [Chryseobacterium sp. 2987]